MSSERALEAAAEALNEHLKGSGNWRNATPAMAQKAVAAYLDSLLGELPEEAVEAARAHETRGEGKDRVTVIDIEQSVRRFLRSLRSTLGVRADE